MRLRSAQPVLVVVGTALSLLASGSPPLTAAQQPTPRLEMPQPVRAEHEMLHLTLMESTKAPGRVGEAGRALAAVLEPHFGREEKMVMPLLGLLAPLAAGTAIPPAVGTQALAMSDALRREMNSMLDEHKKITAAVETLRQAAIAERTAKFQEFAEDLARHARDEEDVMYPAAILVGDAIRARQTAR